MSQYADILLPLFLEPLTYEIDPQMGLCVGDGVAVEMGQNEEGRFLSGIVWRLHDNKPPFERIRKVEKRLYDLPLLSPQQLKFWEWLADYYLCLLGEVMRSALPALIKPSGVDLLDFELSEFKARLEWYVDFHVTNEIDDELLSKIERKAPRQASALIELLAYGDNCRNERGEIPRRVLENNDLTVLRSLEKKSFLTLHQRPRESENVGNIGFILPTLSPTQQEALKRIKAGHKERPCCLLHGITGSGKSEIYMHLIADALARNEDVLLLLPEIALTQQLIERMERVFGSRVVAYHSKITRSKRTELYFELRRSKQGGRFIIGARSSIFLPFNDLGLIVVDEEHDSSYKQSDPAPRYNARDCSHILASIYGAKVVLGSATPSLESWMNGRSGKFSYVTLNQRYGGAIPPKITISDTRRAVRRAERRGHFNTQLLEKIDERARRGEQSMLLQNRRGYAPYVECGECGWVARCPNCNVSLTMHKHGGRLICHYCDYFTPNLTVCPTCQRPSIKTMGFGTEKIEEQLQGFMPELKISRMDRDTADSPLAAQRIISDFANGQKNVLIGTQMIAKGLDFDRVTLVGILNADNIFLAPDFRAEERAYSLIMQVAGRAGRREGVDAEVLIQTAQPEHRILKLIKDGDYEQMARTLLPEREAFFYPPYSRIIAINLKHKDVKLLHESANSLSFALRQRFAQRVRGPVAPPVDRILGEWIVSIFLKIESGASSQKAKRILREIFAEWQAKYKSIRLSCDVDPQ